MTLIRKEFDDFGEYNPEFANKFALLLCSELTEGQQRSIREKGYVVLSDPTGGYKEKEEGPDK